MSRCELRIQLLEEPAVYQLGDTVSGFIHVDVDAAVKCRGLHVKLVCKSHGRGNRWTSKDNSVVLFTGQWQPGEDLVFPFELTLPDGPPTYEGRIIHLSWYVETWVDIPWAVDPVAEQEIDVFPGKGVPFMGDAPPEFPEVTQPVKMLGTLASIFMGFTVVCGGLGACFSGGDPGALPGFLLFAFALFLFFPVIGFFVLRNSLAQRKLGAVEFIVEPRDVMPGDEVTVTIRCNPPKPLGVRRVLLKFGGEEVAVSGSGSNRTTHRHPLFEEEHALATVATLSGPTTWTRTWTIPADAAPSFWLSDNTVEWTVGLHIDVPKWPDYHHGRRLRVAPKPL